MAYRREDMWSNEHYEYDRLLREHLAPQSNPEDDYHREGNIASKKPPLEYRIV
uniref:Uncharacterized protein n=1 Tax=Vombatus ursinus TaxID=29139 RepID=A0A4X2K609_VOMUR